MKAIVDEISFYNVAMSAQQAKNAYDSYAVDQSKLDKLKKKISKLKEYSISFYTRETYEVLEEKLLEAEQVASNPVTDANVDRMLGELDLAKDGLLYYKGVTSETTFTNAQLKAETEIAQELAGYGTLLEESKTALDILLCQKR